MITKSLPERCCSYLEGVFKPVSREHIINQCVEALTPHLDKFDAIAVSGYSMALIAPVVADKLGKSLILVRKSGTKEHSSHKVEGVICKSYIIIDDLLCSGNTIKGIRKAIAKYFHAPANLYGLYMYKLECCAWKKREQIAREFGCALLNTDKQILLATGG